MIDDIVLNFIYLAVGGVCAIAIGGGIIPLIYLKFRANLNPKVINSLFIWRLGLRTSLFLTFFYATAYVVNFFFALVSDQINQGKLFSEALGIATSFTLFASAVIYSLSFLVGFIPSTLIIIPTGILLNKILKRIDFKYLKSFQAPIIGVIVGGVVVIAIHLLLLIRFNWSFTEFITFLDYDKNILLGSFATGYPFWIGYPSIIYIIASGWLSKKIYELQNKPELIQTWFRSAVQLYSPGKFGLPKSMK